jgi:hypothetical protein
MGTWPLVHRNSICETIGALTASSNLTNVVAGNLVKGAYSELIASTTRAYNCFVLHIADDQARRQVGYDIAIGGAGSEQVLVPDIRVRLDSLSGSFNTWVPIAIPRGVRVAVRGQGKDATNRNSKVGLTCSAIDWTSGIFGSDAEQFGIAYTAVSGAAIDPGAVANTKGAYTQVAASTAKHWKGFILCVAHHDNASIGGDFRYLLDIAVGAAASETVVIPNMHYAAGDFTDNIMDGLRYIPFPIPSGSRISARSQCNQTDASDRVFHVTVVGVVA